jgi:predicted RNA-binding Zn-ribbon protein involved in translation (DUF1610 family)
MASLPEELTRKSKPTIAERASQPICPECGGTVVRRSAKGPRPKFCCDEHKRAFGARKLAQGYAVIGLLKGWRIDRGSGEIAQKAFGQVCTILDQFNAEDAAANRPRADLYAAKLMFNASQYLDRQAPKNRAKPERKPRPETELERALRLIAEGHNDPRKLAAETLGHAA